MITVARKVNHVPFSAITPMNPEAALLRIVETPGLPHEVHAVAFQGLAFIEQAKREEAEEATAVSIRDAINDEWLAEWDAKLEAQTGYDPMCSGGERYPY